MKNDHKLQKQIQDRNFRKQHKYKKKSFKLMTTRIANMKSKYFMCVCRVFLFYYFFF